MKISWQAVVDAIAAIYKAFFSGKKVGGVVLPNEGQVPPLRGSKFDSSPASVQPPNLTGRPR